jgi:hypothetical protein
MHIFVITFQPLSRLLSLGQYRQSPVKIIIILHNLHILGDFMQIRPSLDKKIAKVIA